jgi:spore coat protein U-like protein
MRKILLAVTLMLTFGLMAGGSVYADTLNLNLNVSATVLPACSASVTPVNFGNYSGDYLYANGDITVTCLQGTPYHIALDAGRNYRQISNGMNGLLSYSLYKDMSGTEWGDSDYANTYPRGSSLTDWGTGFSQAHTVYGVLRGGQTASEAGTYSDTVQVSIYY